MMLALFRLLNIISFQMRLGSFVLLGQLVYYAMELIDSFLDVRTVYYYFSIYVCNYHTILLTKYSMFYYRLFAIKYMQKFILVILSTLYLTHSLKILNNVWKQTTHLSSFLK